MLWEEPVKMQENIYIFSLVIMDKCITTRHDTCTDMGLFPVSEFALFGMQQSLMPCTSHCTAKTKKVPERTVGQLMLSLF